MPLASFPLTTKIEPEWLKIKKAEENKPNPCPSAFSIYSLTPPYHSKIIQKTGTTKLQIPPAPIVRELFLSA